LEAWLWMVLGLERLYAKSNVEGEHKCSRLSGSGL